MNRLVDRRLLFECAVTLWAAARAASAQLDELEWLNRGMAEAVTGSITTDVRALWASKEGRLAADTTTFTATRETASAIIRKACGVRTYPAHDDNIM